MLVRPVTDVRGRSLGEPWEELMTVLSSRFEFPRPIRDLVRLASFQASVSLNTVAAIRRTVTATRNFRWLRDHAAEHATPSQGNYSAVTGIWTVGSLAANATATLVLKATVTVAAALTNPSDPKSLG